jgi:hypothetical protein
MARWCFLLAFFVLSAFGQSSENAVDPTRISKEVVQAILGASLGQGKPTVAAYENLVVLGPEAASACSVPLIEAQIPKDVTFTIAQVPPPDRFRDNMPVAHWFPACPTGAGR